MSGPDWASLRSDYPADHYLRQALDEQREHDEQADDQADADVA